jgi:hypothetical protein
VVAVFKTDAFNRSATHPSLANQKLAILGKRNLGALAPN